MEAFGRGQPKIAQLDRDGFDSPSKDPWLRVYCRPAQFSSIRRRVGWAGGAYVPVGGMGYLGRKKTMLRVYLWGRVRFVSRMMRKVNLCIRGPAPDSSVNDGRGSRRALSFAVANTRHVPSP